MNIFDNVNTLDDLCNVFVSVSILGVDYRIIFDKDFSSFVDKNSYGKRFNDLAGVTLTFEKKIHISCESIPYDFNENKKEWCDMAYRYVRHEIIHAFMFESGLDYSCESGKDYGWATCEEMIDWWALNSPKVFNIFNKIGAF